MEKAAFICGQTVIYWGPLILTLAAAAGIFAFLSMYCKNPSHTVTAAVAVVLTVFLSAVLGRLIHWYSRTDSYPDFRTAMLNHSVGSYALAGVFLACLITAGVLKLLRLCRDLPRLLDCAALSVGIAIAVGRLSFFFNASDRGLIVPASWPLPLGSTVINPVSGVTETRLATFLLQSIVTALIVGVLLLRSSPRRKLPLIPGDACLLFLTYYCCSQVFFDSTRYDSLFLRSNGFVSIVQILCAVALAAVMVFFTVPLFTAKKRKSFFLLWLLFLAFTGGAGFMEYYVQRHGDQAAFAYSVMILCLTAMAVVATIAHSLGDRAAVPKTAGKFLRK